MNSAGQGPGGTEVSRAPPPPTDISLQRPSFELSGPHEGMGPSHINEAGEAQ